MSTTTLFTNNTLATLSNKTEVSVKSISWHPKSNSSEYFNHTINNSSTYNPNCPDCFTHYVTIGPPIITYSYSYAYAYYGVLLILLIVALVCIKMGISRRKGLERRAAAQRRRARQQVESPYVQTTSDNNNNNTSSSAKDTDLPPAYEDVVQSYMLTKQQQQQCTENTQTGMTTNSSANTISEAISTLTIATEISSSKRASGVNINNPSMPQ